MNPGRGGAGGKPESPDDAGGPNGLKGGRDEGMPGWGGIMPGGGRPGGGAFGGIPEGKIQELKVQRIKTSN